ncbi:MAG TPA: hypothetical protein VFU76_07400, partial [Terriglobales bacterium]|nr:hypothetical protein [Terriglobales bacterium]
DRKNVELVIVEAVHMATFGLFTVVDGVSAIEEGPDNGDFELYWVRGSERVLLNPPTGEELHDLYNWFSRDQYHAK